MMAVRKWIQYGTCALLLVGVVGELGGCRGQDTPANVPKVETKTNPKQDTKNTKNSTKEALKSPQPTATNLPAPKLPPLGGSMSPSFVEMAKGEKYDHKVMLETKQCGECHESIVKEWGASMHALASLNNPLYRLSFDDFRKVAGADKLKFCGGCHDIAMVMDDTLEAKTIDADKPATHAGITCNACHGVTEANVEGNASYVLSTKPIVIPKDKDPKSLAAHKKRLGNTTLRTNALCVSCHRGFFSPDTGHEVPLAGLAEWSVWRGSSYNGGVGISRIDPGAKAQNCVSCHMPKTKEGHLSHRFPGGHTTYAHAQGKAQMDAQVTLLKDAATLDIHPSPLENPPKDTNILTLDVVVFNETTGHHFPGGARDLRDTWLEMVVEDESGKRLAVSGVEHAKTGREENAHLFRVHQVDKTGSAQREHNVSHFRTPVFDNTIGPRDAKIVRYQWTRPASLKGPVKVTATIKHRRVSRTIFDRACAESKTARGKAFLKGTLKYNGLALDPCKAQPIVDIATHSQWFGVGSSKKESTKVKRPMWQRMYRHGLGLEHQVQENLEEALKTIKRAQKALPKNATNVQKGMLILEEAKIVGRQGRTDDAFKLFAQARKLVPKSPAPLYGKGKAAMQVWRFKDAISALTEASEMADDDRIWQQLAIAYGSEGKAKEALAAAQRGLILEPRNPHLLRSQMLSYRQLKAPKKLQDKVNSAFDVYKRDIQAPEVRNKCSKNADWCRRERVPVHIHTLSAVKP